MPTFFMIVLKPTPVCLFSSMKAFGLIFVKEFGKFTLYFRNKEVYANVLHEIVKREERLFTNNIGLCKREIFSIKFETCPLLVTKNRKFFAFF